MLVGRGSETACVMAVELYAPTVYKALNGVFCVYKPPGQTIFKLVHALRTNLARGTVNDIIIVILKCIGVGIQGA